MKRLRSRRATPRYRRAPHVVCYWDDTQEGQLVLHNFATGVRAAAAPLTIELLARCSEWVTLPAIVRALELPDGMPIDMMMDVLVESTFLERSDRPAPAESRAYATWGTWNPAAGFFHASTKDVPFATPVAADGMLREKAKRDPAPPMVKGASRGSRATMPLAHASTTRNGKTGTPIDLPPAALMDGLTDALMQRRTWRKFGTHAIARADLATLLHLTWGIQQWVTVEGVGRMPLKTSPSGGARHSIEAYALIRRVDGVKAGLYHYGPDDHRLTRLAPADVGKVSDYLPHQTWYDEAAVVVFMTAVFARAQWRYGYARAYRSILAEAGHLAQTFCLVATRLGLAPFCSMAMADTRVEQDLGIDGVTESVVYAVGAGSRPPGVAWAPWPDTNRVPARSAPAWARKRQESRKPHSKAKSSR